MKKCVSSGLRWPPRSSRAARRRRAATLTLTAAIPTAHKPTAANPAAFA